jgi:hypothetical protein
MSSSISSFALAVANISVAGELASVLYNESDFTALAMEACMRSANARARSKYAVEGVPSVEAAIGTCTGVPCAEPRSPARKPPSPQASPPPRNDGDAPARDDDITAARGLVTRSYESSWS